MHNKVYINAIKQISAQQFLSDNWFEQPVLYTEQYVQALDPDYKQFFTPNEVRRFGKILKRALLVSRLVMKESEISSPDAIITGTGLGCVENTEIFLNKLVFEGEELLNPTYFMQSTHNTISSLIAIDSKCYSYNNTFSHKGISFECALQDAFIQMKTNNIQTALVGAFDELTPTYFKFLKKINFLGQSNQTFAGETSVAMMLTSAKSEKSLCEIEFVEKVYSKNLQKKHIDFLPDNIDYLMIGTNGDVKNDNIFLENCEIFFPNIPLLQYKHIFGEGYTVPAFGVYASSLCMKNGLIPEHLILNKSAKSQYSKKISKILCYNQFEGKHHTFILLSKC